MIYAVVFVLVCVAALSVWHTKRHINRRTQALDLRLEKLLLEARRLEYDARTLNKETLDALLEVRQHTEKYAHLENLNHVLVEEAAMHLRDTRALMNDLRQKGYR